MGFQTSAATPSAGAGVRSIRRTAVYGPVRTVVWQGSAGDRRPYADQVKISVAIAGASDLLYRDPLDELLKVGVRQAVAPPVEIHDVGEKSASPRETIVVCPSLFITKGSRRLSNRSRKESNHASKSRRSDSARVRERIPARSEGLRSGLGAKSAD